MYFCGSTPAVGEELNLQDYSPFSFVNLNFTHGFFESGDLGDGVTMGISASKSFSHPEKPLFMKVFANYSKADDELAISVEQLKKNPILTATQKQQIDKAVVELGDPGAPLTELSVQLRQNILRYGIIAGYEGKGDRHQMYYLLLGHERNDADRAVLRTDPIRAPT